ncbi:MAG: hypothetical protein JWN29_3559 [Acidimicrobiales bacterium]|nr:hypothetical protein [Acidimicrobiales bacterium]
MQQQATSRLRSAAPVLWVFGAAVVVRLVIVAAVHEPVIFADEAAPFLIARTLLGHHPTPTMGNDAFYHAGYALLLAPWTALFGVAGAWRAATVLNAVLLATMVPLVYWLTRDILRARPPLALATAAVVSLYPAFVLEAGLTWSESAVLPVVLLSFVLCSRVLRRPTVPAAVAFGASAVAAYAVHPRLVPILVLAPVALWLARRWHGLPVTAAAAGTAVVVIGLVAVRVLHGWLRARLYLDAPGSDEQEVVTRIFRDPANAVRALAAFTGQAWYLTVATFGLAPLGAWQLAQEVRRSPRRVDVLFVVASVATLLAISSLFVIDPKRVDQRVYGRYAETFLAVLLAAGIVSLARAAHRRPTLGQVACMLGVPVLLGAALLLGWGSDNFRGVLNPLNVLGIEQFVQLEQYVNIFRITAVTVAGGAALLALRALPRPWGAPVALVVLAGLFTASFVRTDRSVILPIHTTRKLTSTVPAGIHEVERLTGLRIRRVDIAYVAGKQGGEFFGYQLLLPDVEFDPFDASTEPVPHGPWVLGSKAWPQGVAAGARLVFPEGLVDSALWVLPGPEQDRLTRAGITPADDPAIPLQPSDLRARVTAARTLVRLSPTAVPVNLQVRLEQDSGRPWPSNKDAPAPGGVVRLKAEWVPSAGGAPIWGRLVDLPRRLLPGETTDVTVPLVAVAPDGVRPPSGRYRLRFALVQEGGTPVPASGTDITLELR